MNRSHVLCDWFAGPIVRRNTPAAASTAKGNKLVKPGPKAPPRAATSSTLSVQVPFAPAPFTPFDSVAGTSTSPRIATELEYKRALAVLQEHGMVAVSLDSQVASIRRHAASALQNPSGKSTDLMTTSLYVENIGLVALEQMLDSKYWVKADISLAARYVSRNEQRVDFTTNSSKALNQLFCAQDTRNLGQDAAKLICPKGHKEATLMVFASPPGVMRFRRRADSTEIVEGSFNLSTLNEVRTGLVLHATRARARARSHAHKHAMTTLRCGVCVLLVWEPHDMRAT